MKSGRDVFQRNEPPSGRLRAKSDRSRDARASSSAAEWVATSISRRRLKRGIGQGDHHDIKCTLGCGSDLHVRGSGLQQDRTDRSTAGTRAHHCRDFSTGRKRGYHSALVDDCIHHSLRRGAARTTRCGTDYTETALSFRAVGPQEAARPRDPRQHHSPAARCQRGLAALLDRRLNK